MINNFEILNILRKLKKNPIQPQRSLAAKLGFSLGKLNYVVKALKNKGLIKIKNFKNNKSKLKYIYILTPLGITYKSKLTYIFMKQKLKEYDELKLEYENNKQKNKNASLFK